MWWTTTLSMTTWVKSGVASADQLDEERRDEHVAPDALVLEELAPEPAEAESGNAGAAPSSSESSLTFSCRSSSACGSKRSRSSSAQVAGFWLPASKYRSCLPSDLTISAGRGDLALQERDARKARLGEPALAGAKTERLDRFEELMDGVRAGKRCTSSAGSNGTRFSWHKLPTSHTNCSPDSSLFRSQIPLPGF